MENVLQTHVGESGRTEILHSKELGGRRISACKEILASIASKDPEFTEIPTVIEWLGILDSAQLLNDTLPIDSFTSERVCKITVALVDEYEVDEIAPRGGTEERSYIKSAYSRSNMEVDSSLLVKIPEGVYSNLVLMTPLEADELLSEMKETYEGSLAHVHDSIPELVNFYNASEEIYISQAVGKYYSLDDVGDKLEAIFTVKTQNGWWVTIPVVYGNLKGFLDIQKFPSNKDETIYAISRPFVPEINSGISRQDLWYELAKKGINIFKDNDPTPNNGVKESEHISLLDKEGLNNKIDKFLKDKFISKTGVEALIPRKVLRTWLNPETDFVNQLNANEKFYKKEFGTLENGVESDVRLTRSGVSAIELSMNLALTELKKRKAEIKVFKLPGWYYENTKLQNLELLAKDVDECTVLLVNHESNPPGFGDYETYAKKRDFEIDKFLAKVRRNPGKDYAIVYDKTTDMNFHLFKGLDMPKNLIYLEAVSLTKHQRGQRHGFYGAMYSYDNRIKIPEEMVARNHANLTEYGISTFPHISSKEHARVRAEFTERAELVRERFGVIVSDMDSSWEIEVYPYYFFVTPPDKEIFKTFVSEYEPTQEFSQKDKYSKEDEILEAYESYLAKNGYSGLDFKKASDDWAAGNKFVEVGDSYGLEKIRLTFFGSRIEIPTPFGFNVRYAAIIPRISFGLGVSREDTINAVSDYFKKLRPRET